MTRRDVIKRKRDAVREAELNGDVADSMDVRMAMVKRYESGEISMEEMQSGLASIKKAAKRNGKTTRANVFRNS